MRKATDLGAFAVLAVVVAGGVAAATMRSPARGAVPEDVGAPLGARAVVSLLVDGNPSGAGAKVRAVDWDAPLRLTGMDGTVESAEVTGPAGVVAGHVAGGVWVSDSSLLPEAVYRIKANLTGSDGKASTAETVATTVPAAEVLHATIGTGDGDVVGVGEPVVITFNHSIPTAAARRQVTDRLSVAATPAVTGARG